MAGPSTSPGEPSSALIFSATDLRFRLKQTFRISRAAKTEAHVCEVTIADADGRTLGRGECVPYARYGETVAGVLADLRTAFDVVSERMASTGRAADAVRAARIVLTQEALMPAGAARNALDCALWDAEAKLTGQSVAELCGIGFVAPVATCVTLSLADPAPMAAEAKTMSFQSLKLKLGSDGADTDIARLNAVRAARPDARLIVDANEAWSADDLPALLSAANTNGVSLIEQPLPAGDDAMLANIARPVPVCADEALHTVDDLADLRPRYDAINIKLDKTGGLTHALELAEAARAAGFRIMIGSMVSSSLAMAPAVLLAQDAEWVDLDSPALLAEDREPALTITDGEIAKPASALWG